MGNIDAVDSAEILFRQDIFCFSESRCPTFAEQQGMSAVQLCHAEIMHDRDNRSVALLSPGICQFEDLLLKRQIEMVGWFVQNQDLRILREELRQKNTLNLSARKCSDRADKKIFNSRGADGARTRLFIPRRLTPSTLTLPV